MITIRIRSAFWFASGVAVALLLVAVFVGIRARAAVDANETTFVPISPCRLFDTRPGEFNVGPRSTPIGPKESHVQQVTGSNGQCVVPSDATGVALNVTAVAPSAASFLTLYPADVAVPNASNLNFVAGGNPTPNKVDVKLSPTGTIGVYNAAGSVHVLADVVGYYTPKGLADLQAQISAKANTADLAAKANTADLAAKANTADVYTKAQVDALLAAKVNRPTGNSTITVPSAAFSVGNSALALEFDLGFSSWNNNGAVEGCVVSPLLLPAGVTVTSMTAGFYGGGSAISLKLYKMLNGSNLVATEMASAATTGTSLSYEVTDSTITSPVIDLSTNRYHLSVCLSAGGSEFDYAKITFTYPA